MHIFSLEQRVYYENTDAGGVVFYGEYLRFFERARTEFLRQQGYSVADLLTQTDPILFVVRKAEIEYLKPLFLDDKITITAGVLWQKQTSFMFEQKIYRDDVCTTTALILCVATDKTGKPKRNKLIFQ